MPRFMGSTGKIVVSFDSKYSSRNIGLCVKKFNIFFEEYVTFSYISPEGQRIPTPNMAHLVALEMGFHERYIRFSINKVNFFNLIFPHFSIP